MVHIQHEVNVSFRERTVSMEDGKAVKTRWASEKRTSYKMAVHFSELCSQKGLSVLPFYFPSLVCLLIYH